jgi:hypothetical protein
MHKLLTEFTFRSKLIGFQSQSFFRLRIKRWIDNLRVDENPQMISDLKWFDFQSFMLLFDDLYDGISNLIYNIVNMGSSSRRAN